MKKLLLLASAALCCLTAFYSCNEKDNAVINHDSTSTLYPENADNSIKPGDDFYNHCVGSWIQNTNYSNPANNYEGYLFTQLGYKWMEMSQNVSSDDMALLQEHMLGIGTSNQTDIEATDDALARIKAAKSTEELWQLMGKFYTEGYQMPFTLISLAKGGTMKLAVLPTKDLEIESTINKNSHDVNEDEQDDNDDYNEWSDGDWTNWNDYDNNYNYWEELVRSGRLAELVEPIVSQHTTRGFAPEKWPMLVGVCKGLGVDPDKVYVITEDFYDVAKDELKIKSVDELESLQLLDKDQLAEIVSQYIYDSRLLCDAELLKQTEEETGEELTGDNVMSSVSEYLKYYVSKILADNLCKPEMRTLGQQYVAELKQAFNERIAANEWISEASKQVAIEKMNAMAVNIAYPDWIEEGLPNFSQTQTLFQDVIEIRRANCRLAIQLLDMPVDQGSFHSATAFFIRLMEFNAFYAPMFNSMNILPCWFIDDLLMKPNAPLAETYALLMVFGHEMTHGFDNNGAQWDKLGDKNTIWTSEADAAEFARRAKLLQDYYSTVEIKPGTFANGEKTLPENIADLGGTELAFQAFTNKLKSMGISGEELRQQQRNFFVALANLWRAKYNEEHIMTARSSDVHSLDKERINCVVANIDAWYDLFDVKPGDKLYRSPEERVHIW